ncbi:MULTISPECIES: response regulator transcription factor [unclassified Streptomyces]|uniref:response regulator transcription factor n=1 Tax=unclassified Streptomyces TaxID=2593676 RepID=UPI000F508CC1|nr:MULTISPECIES: response regulator transcription factor [unclassified Streptomyces]MDH6449932.1 DNA-binding NarL/FixJ family response regulator [Streptomyces sp. SAI-119]MDH6499618.1 DNA-binding NarL/FixJ family response regulator [Streptomyces sp. SAI-149]
MTEKTLRVLIVDDHTVVRAGLRALLEGEPGLDVIAETGDGREAVRLAQRLRPDVVLMDLRLSDSATSDDGFGGIEATRRITAAAPGVHVVVLTSYSGRGDVVRAVEAGARGYILKAGPPEELFRAVRAAAAGGMGLAPEAAARLVGRSAEPGPVFTDRESEVVRLLAEGLSNRAIASALFVTEATVKTHLVRIYRKLGTENRAGTVSEAVRLGLLELDVG